MARMDRSRRGGMDGIDLAPNISYAVPKSLMSVQKQLKIIKIHSLSTSTPDQPHSGRYVMPRACRWICSISFMGKVRATIQQLLRRENSSELKRCINEVKHPAFALQRFPRTSMMVASLLCYGYGAY